MKRKNLAQKVLAEVGDFTHDVLVTHNLDKPIKNYVISKTVKKTKSNAKIIIIQLIFIIIILLISWMIPNNKTFRVFSIASLYCLWGFNLMKFISTTLPSWIRLYKKLTGTSGIFLQHFFKISFWSIILNGQVRLWILITICLLFLRSLLIKEGLQ